MAKKKESKKNTAIKKKVLSEIFQHCESTNKYTFDNDLVKKFCAKHNFKNPFDVTKIDNLSVLPDDIRSKGYCVIHIGQGEHRFINEINHCFHNFEEIENLETLWKYRKSALNEIDTSESNILSVGFNQRIIHDFLYDDIVASPKMYGSKRTKISSSYFIGENEINVNKLQMEIDLVTEYRGVVTVFEGKNKFPKNFAVYQLFLPFLYFSNLKNSKEINIDSINCCYLLRDKKDGESTIRLYLYNFSNVNDMASINLIKCEQYRLIQR